jgi:hypothetical protein
MSGCQASRAHSPQSVDPGSDKMIKVAPRGLTIGLCLHSHSHSTSRSLFTKPARRRRPVKLAQRMAELGGRLGASTDRSCRRSPYASWCAPSRSNPGEKPFAHEAGDQGSVALDYEG